MHNEGDWFVLLGDFGATPRNKEVDGSGSPHRSHRGGRGGSAIRCGLLDLRPPTRLGGLGSHVLHHQWHHEPLTG